MPLWDDTDVEKLGKHASCRLLRSGWCTIHGDEFCAAILEPNWLPRRYVLVGAGFPDGRQGVSHMNSAPLKPGRFLPASVPRALRHLAVSAPSVEVDLE